MSEVRRNDSVPADASLLNFGKCFPNSLFLFPIWKIRRHLLPSGHLEMALTVQKARCNLEMVQLYFVVLSQVTDKF